MTFCGVFPLSTIHHDMSKANQCGYNLNVKINKTKLNNQVYFIDLGDLKCHI